MTAEDKELVAMFAMFLVALLLLAATALLFWE
jgi:hypothetical protein